MLGALASYSPCECEFQAVADRVSRGNVAKALPQLWPGALADGGGWESSIRVVSGIQFCVKYGRSPAERGNYRPVNVCPLRVLDLELSLQRRPGALASRSHCECELQAVAGL